jgi:hypothetical protein
MSGVRFLLLAPRRITMKKKVVKNLSKELDEIDREIAGSENVLRYLKMQRADLKLELQEKKLKATDAPKVGDDIYVGSSYYIDHGEDDFEGGLCRVTQVSLGTSAGKKVPFILIQERPGHSYNWEYLKAHQAEWKKEFGKRRGYEDPDFG